MTCLTMTRRRWSGCSGVLCPTGPTVPRWRSLPPEARRFLGDGPAAARATAARKWDRTPGTEPAVQMANQVGLVFGKLDCTARWRERLSELAIPALVVRCRRDPFFPAGVMAVTPAVGLSASRMATPCLARP